MSTGNIYAISILAAAVLLGALFLIADCTKYSIDRGYDPVAGQVIPKR